MGLNNSPLFFAEVCVGISSQVKYSLQAFWAVSIRDLHISLWRPWSELQMDSASTDRSIVEEHHYQHLAVDIRSVNYRSQVQVNTSTITTCKLQKQSSAQRRAYHIKVPEDSTCPGRPTKTFLPTRDIFNP